MSKDEWHIEIKEQKISSIRHYSWLSKMYDFVLRNPRIFAHRKLTIYRNGIPFMDTNYNKIKTRKENLVSEKHERRLLNYVASMYGYNPNRKINDENLLELYNIQHFPNIVDTKGMHRNVGHPRIKSKNFSIRKLKDDYENLLKNKTHEDALDILSSKYSTDIDLLYEAIKFVYVNEEFISLKKLDVKS